MKLSVFDATLNPCSARRRTERDTTALQLLQQHHPTGTRHELRHLVDNCRVGGFAKDFRAELAELGLPAGRKSERVAPPAVPFDAAGYLRGLVDGDGSVGFTSERRPFISFTTASAALAEHFCTEVRRMANANRTFRQNKRDSVFNVMIASDPQP